MAAQNQIGLKPSFGQILWGNGETGANISLTTTPTEQNNIGGIPYVLTSSSTSDFQLFGTGRLRYVGSRTRDFLISGIMSQGNPAFGIYTRLYLNSTTALGQSQFNIAYYQTQPIRVTLSQNDYISMYAWRPAVTLAFFVSGVTAWSLP